MSDRDSPRDAYQREAIARVFHKVQESNAFLSIVSQALNQDPHALMEIGMAVVLDKPILLLVPEDQEIPKNLRRLALAIETFRSEDDIGLATERLLAVARERGL